MNKHITFRNMEKTPQIEDQVLRELNKLNKLINPEDPLTALDCVITVEGPTHNLYNIEIRLSEAHNKSVAHAEGYDFNLVLASAVNKMMHELSKAKERALDKRDRPDESKKPWRKDKADFER